MAEETKIQWCHHTFNPWIGCSKVHAGCTNCYAESDMDKRRGRVSWGPNGTRSSTTESYWQKPFMWNRRAEKADERRRVFCASLADVFEDWQGPILDHKGERVYHAYPPSGTYWTESMCRQAQAEGHTDIVPLTMDDLRADLFDLIDQTPHLDWLLLTKRPENIQRMWPQCGRGNYRQNVWLGTSISDQATADKAIPELMSCRDLSPVLFVSAEPLLGPVDFCNIEDGEYWVDCINGVWSRHRKNQPGEPPDGTTHTCILNLIIFGGESGPNARPCNVEWIRSGVQQCQAAGVSAFVKQLGSNLVTRNDLVEDQFNNQSTGWPDPDVEHHIHGFREDYQGADCRVRLQDPKGGDPSEWPEDLRVREIPVAEAVSP